MSRRRIPGVLLLVLLLAPLAACEAAENPPDEELREALGVGSDREVRTVRMEIAEGTEMLDPEVVEIRPGYLVEFRSDDRRVRTVAFETDSLGSEAASFIVRTGQEGSPPLVETEARFVVDFTDAPVGRYPFVVEGSARPARGAIVVGDSG